MLYGGDGVTSVSDLCNVRRGSVEGGTGGRIPPNFLEGGENPPKCAKKLSFSCLRRLKTWLRPPKFFVVAEPLNVRIFQ